MLQRASVASMYRAGRRVPLAVAAAALLCAWYAWIFAPTLGLERERALAGSLQQGLAAALQSLGAAEDESRARELVVTIRREMPKLRRLAGVDVAALEIQLQ